MKTIMNTFTIASLLLLTCTSQAFSDDKTISIPLTQDEIQNAIALFDRLGVPSKSVNADCSQSEATIRYRVKGFNPANWWAEFSDDSGALVSLRLEREEIANAIDLFDRADVPSIKVDSITYVSTATIFSRACNLRKARWTITFSTAN